MKTKIRNCLRVFFRLLPSSQLPASSSSAGKKIITLLIFLPLSAAAEPWINTSDASLRSDIETLADVGIIQVPITTYPLMWAGVLKDLDQVETRDVESAYRDIYWRVKSAGKFALSYKPVKRLKFSAGSSEQIFRSFGDDARNEFEFSASRTGLNKYFAWNLQVNRVVDPFDKDTLHYGGSYVAAVWGNWIASVGKVEKWWGSSWDSANLLSNNARAPLGITLDRNYAQPIDLPVLEWLGPWSVSGFTGQLNDDRVINNPYLSGISFSAKPLDSLETSLRATFISGGSGFSTTNTESKKLTSFDLRWRLPKALNLPANLYASVTDEGITSGIASKQLGFSSHLNLFEIDWRVFIEATQTHGSGEEGFDSTYEDGFYRTGYRYNQRSIGSTFDNDSKAVSLGIIGKLTRYQSVEAKIQSVKLNQNTVRSTLDSGHSISSVPIDVKRVSIKWKFQANKNHHFEVAADLSNKVFDGLQRQTEKIRVSASWSYFL